MRDQVVCHWWARPPVETAEGIPPVDKLEILANSEEACLSAPAVAEKSKPYTLTFSASGTMKAALPPGVSPSSSSTSGIGLMPSFVSPNQGASQIGTQEYRDSIEERVPTADGDEESALDTVLAQEEDEDGNSDRSVIDLLARKQVLEGKVQGMGANDDEDDIAEWASRIHATRPIERVGAAAGGGIGEVPARREVDSDASQEEVAVGGRENELHEEAETGSEVHEKESSPIQPHEELPSSATEEPDTGRKMDHTVEVASDENNASTTEAKNTAEDDSSSTASSSEEVASAETPSESESQGEATAETQSDGKLKTESDGPNTSLEAGLADVEKALKE
ncbi:uncharacterized protein FOMMEDRAFT_152788 [Fomitiporia mediterranea MF3/22]|uniref:uncharacterized protein n=1 Tax=Fomitiporia mediterranea (strain MF3/22) TaxID=694068 RepID=UPI00044086E2|nr:uncharacterized protein FOMMEDRAFT_152788 [Fomitiporia mediterranea MF3/22]EJD05474.1 hypothetical protein FOMMEDRAFT_152788 [Fomitiporia mediterranea MF3/22]